MPTMSIIAVSCGYDLSECIPMHKQQPARSVYRLNYINLFLYVNDRRYKPVSIFFLWDNHLGMSHSLFKM